MQAVTQKQFKTATGIRISRSSRQLSYDSAIKDLADRLDQQMGVLLASSFEYPGRYTRWDIGFANPPLRIVSRAYNVTIDALNQRGEVLLAEIYRALHQSGLFTLEKQQARLLATISPGREEFTEEQRSRRPTVFSLLRVIIDWFRVSDDPYLGLYGAFGYDLTFQFEDVERFQTRCESDRDMVLFFPDQIIVVDHRIEEALCHSYEFVCRAQGGEKFTEITGGLKRSGTSVSYVPDTKPNEKLLQKCDHAEGEYAENVGRALEFFRRGDLFEVVPGQVFYEVCQDSPSQVFNRLRKSNPAPYGALMNLGDDEFLVAASPEMFVRVDGKTIETCPISGTIKRGSDAIADARQIKALLNSSKDESELSMCTDVDRNDKARVCEAGSVEVVGRRQIEMYSRLIHTVDHVKGRLKPEFDALDGFLAHTWAVTVTGAPKHAAMQYIEANEKSPRRWYGGAMGQIGFDGNLNTGLTLRTIRINKGIAEIRAGATLLIDSDPVDEELETRLKASALLDAIRSPESHKKSTSDGEEDSEEVTRRGSGLQLLMVDHQDSFVHNLAAYFRRYGVELVTMRPAMARQYLIKQRPDLVVLSPGPCRPENFDMHATIEICLQQNIPLFGVCLGLQGIVEYFGGALKALDYPMHGKPSLVKHNGSKLFEGVTEEFTAGRYHSLQAIEVPSCLQVSAVTEDNVVMAVEHRTLPIWALQFHPESILSLEGRVGQKIIENVLTLVTGKNETTGA